MPSCTRAGYFLADDGSTTVSRLDTINRAGAEVFKIAIGAIPMLVLSLGVRRWPGLRRSVKHHPQGCQ